MANNIVSVVNYLQLRHCRLAFETADVLTKETRLTGSGCNSDLEIVTTRMCRACLMLMPQLANVANLQMLADEVLLVMPPKTSFHSERRVNNDVSVTVSGSANLADRRFQKPVPYS